MTTASLILLVEDNEWIREALTQVLQVSGYRVLVASQGRQALQLLGSGQLPNVILLDMMMPIMSGYEFLEAKGADPAIAAIPVIVMTAAPVPRKFGSDVQCELKKPLEIDLLLSAIEKAVNGGG